ncbi:MAG: fatty acid desaturase [Planctomycetota bacterium]|nr:fatty acid desaturase [Planctomycetota bacterium]
MSREAQIPAALDVAPDNAVPASSNPHPGHAAAALPHAPRLALPEAVVARQLRWEYALPIGLVHLAALLACLPWLFTWAGLLLFVLGVPLFGQGINLCYHRLLAHRSFSVPPWFEHLLVILAICSLEDTPIRWVTTHRLHHVRSDEQRDPHSPLVSFFWGHVGWLLFLNRDTHSLTAFQTYARDLAGDRFYRRLESVPWLSLAIYVAHALLLAAAGAGMMLLAGGDRNAAVQMGLSVLVWGVLLRTVAVWHVTWSVNSLTHLFGYRSYDTSDNSRNNWLVGLLGSGEGWHNNHHHDPTSATVQHRWWEIDLTYYAIRLLAAVGLAKEIVPRREQRAAARS